MCKQKEIGRLFLSRLMTALVVVVSSAAAQQQPLPPNSKITAGNDSKSDQATNKADETAGKSKLERETGTVNDRILSVLPNYVTLEGAKNVPPLKTGQKFRLASAGVFDWGSFAFNGFLAAISQAKNDPEAWGQGWGAYGKRYGASFADNSIGTYMTTAIYPSLLHEDPRYYQMGKGKFFHRFGYGLSRLFVTRTDSGSTRFNYSESIGNGTAAAISNFYHPADDRTAARNANTFGFLILYDGLSNEVKEFWPDIRRKVFHKASP